MQNYHIPGSHGTPPYPQGPQGSGLEYGQARYGIMPGPGAVLPSMAVFPYGFTGFGTIPGFPGADPSMDAVALAERLNDLHVGPGGNNLRGRGGGNAYGRGGMPGPSGLPQQYYAYGQRMPQQSQQQQQQQQGRPQRGRGPNMQAGGRGGGQQKKKRAQKGLEDNVKRTVYISYVDHQITEENLAHFFSDSGRIVDCRICGDPNSAMRFAFIEFQDLESAAKALDKTGTILGSSPLRVLPSKTAIMPVNRELMPTSNDDIERCSRTIYAANIDKKVDRNDVKTFFESLCGKVSRIRLLGDYAHSTRISFVEFQHAEGALAALNCSGALLGSLPIRVSPSKTPVRIEKEDDDQQAAQG